jgi:hypothetical protein
MRKLTNLLLVLFVVVSAESMLGSRLLNLADKQQNQERNTPAEQQNQPGSTQGQISSNVGVQSVTGCLVQSDQGYALKTENDSEPIETDQDLSQYVNKRIKVTGILEHHNAAAPSSTNGNAGAAQPSAQGHPNRTIAVTEIRLRMIATVIGDCNQPSK